METKENQMVKSEKKVSQTEDFFEKLFDHLERDMPEDCPGLSAMKDNLREEGLEIE